MVVALCEIPPAGFENADAVADIGIKGEGAAPEIMILDPRKRDRECLASSLSTQALGMKVLASDSIKAWIPSQDQRGVVRVVLLNIGVRRISDPTLALEMEDIARRLTDIPLVILSDTEDLSQVVAALDAGAKGYLPPSISVEASVHAIRLVMTGGIFVPAGSLTGMGQRLHASETPDHILAGTFTRRQIAVVEAMRRGKANKIIAHELNLRESTVKVHIRNIMKKIKATNRTEAVYKISSLFPMDFAPGLALRPSDVTRALP